MTGIFIYIDRGASEQVHRAAKELTAALNANDIETFHDEENNPALGSKIYIQVGIKP